MTWLGDAGSAVFGALYANPLVVAVASVVVVVLVALIARQRGLDQAARGHPRRSLTLIGLAVIAMLPLAWYLGSPLILSASVNEPEPSIIARPTGAPSAAASQPNASPRTTAQISTTAPSPPASPFPPAAPDRSGTFHGSDDFHFGRGTARLITLAPGEFVVRLEDFAVRNGPDLYVYLSPSRDGYVPGAIELGRLKADTGNQNYPVPAGVLTDPGRAASVVVWCKQFSHLFATAPLSD